MYIQSLAKKVTRTKFVLCVGPKAWTLVVGIWIRTTGWLLASILV